VAWDCWAVVLQVEPLLLVDMPVVLLAMDGHQLELLAQLTHMPVATMMPKTLHTVLTPHQPNKAIRVPKILNEFFRHRSMPNL
jgi:hypothetical protein